MKANAVVLNETHPAVRVTLQALVVLAFAFATALAAQIRIPVPGSLVPATLQSAVVLLAGLRLGSRRGAMSQAVYVAAGAMGLPLFAGASGVVALFGPTGGYLIGFVLAAWAAGVLNAKLGNGTFVRTWLITFAASIVLFIPGVIQLKFFTASDWTQAIAMGVIPFIVGDILKVSLVASAYTLVGKTKL